VSAKDIPNNQHFEEHVLKGGGTDMLVCIFKSYLSDLKYLKKALRSEAIRMLHLSEYLKIQLSPVLIKTLLYYLINKNRYKN